MYRGVIISKKNCQSRICKRL